MVVQTSNLPEPSTELLPLNHDDFFKGTFKMLRLAKAFLRIILTGELLDCVDLDSLTAEETHLTDEVFKNLHADMVYRVPIKDSEHHVDFFMILEHKSGNDFWTVLQLWGYVCYVIRREFDKADKAGQATVDYRLPPVIAIIVHHGKSRFAGKTELSELFLQLPGIEKYLPKLQAVLFDLSAISENDIPADPDAPELKLVLAALKVVFSKEITAKITDILEELKPIIADDPVLQDIIHRVWCYLVASGSYMDQDYTLLFDTIKTLVEVEPMPTMLEKWTVKAEAKGKAEAGRNMLLAILRKKFNRIPKETEQTILAMTDSIALESWAVQAATCESLDEFVAALGFRQKVNCQKCHNQSWFEIG